MIRRFLPLLAALVAALAVNTVALAQTIDGGNFGTVRIAHPKGPMRGFVVLYSDVAGWQDTDTQALTSLAQHGLFVVGVDTATYLAKLAATPANCHYLVGDAEALSHQLQREAHDASYFTPILAGTGMGGTLAEHVLEVAANNTLAGAVSLNPAAELDARFHSCPKDPTILHDPGLPGFWQIGSIAELPAAITAQIDRLKQDGARVDVTPFAPTAHPDAMLLALLHPHLGARAPDEENVADLPLIELPATSANGMLAIVISGDGGWRDLDQTIARDLQAEGVSIVGMDSLRYFWSHKSPEQTAHDLARIMRTYRRRWHAQNIALVGYSFGADVLPFAYNRLPRDLQANVKLMSLLGFTRAADFEIKVMGWLGLPPSARALPVQPEVARLPPGLVQCFYGEGETDSFCPELAKQGISAIRTTGSHHFGRDYAAIAKLILNGWRERMTKG